MKPFEPAPTYEIADLETIKMVSDPLRLNLLHLVTAQARTVKQAADILHLEPHKLYYHMNLLEEHGLVHLVDQVIVGGVAEAVCEALALSEKLNLPPVRLLKVLGAGAAGGWFLEHRGQSMLENSFSKGFKLSLLLKDLRICQELARELDINMVMVENAIEDYQRLVEQGEGDNDISGLIRLKRITSKQES